MPKNGAPTGLEAELAAILQEFSGRLIEAIRNASFAEVASLTQSQASSRQPIATTRRAPGGSSRPSKDAIRDTPSRVRQTATRRAELGDLVVRALEGAGRPLGVRALSTELGIATDRLAMPLRELRVAGRIKKHGEKRATTYSAT